MLYPTFLYTKISVTKISFPNYSDAVSKVKEELRTQGIHYLFTL